MKKIALFFLFLLPCLAVSQNKNSYDFVIVQEYFSFLKEKNQYNLNELTKFLMNKKGVVSLYESEEKPFEFNFEKCKILHLDVTKENAFLSTKLKLTLTDCNGKIVTESIGTSKEKDYKTAYNYALRNAFDNLKIPDNTSGGLSDILEATQQERDTETPIVKSPGFLYAQKTSHGFNLLDSNDVEQYKLVTSSNGAHFLISGQDKNGILYKSGQVWLFEYIKDGKINTEVLKIKF